MSTVADAALADLASAYESDAGEPEHGVCAVCYPTSVPAGGRAICGYLFPEEEPVVDCPGLHKCAKCLTTRFYPCGH